MEEISIRKLFVLVVVFITAISAFATEELKINFEDYKGGKISNNEINYLDIEDLKDYIDLKYEFDGDRLSIKKKNLELEFEKNKYVHMKNGINIIGKYRFEIINDDIYIPFEPVAEELGLKRVGNSYYENEALDGAVSLELNYSLEIPESVKKGDLNLIKVPDSDKSKNSFSAEDTQIKLDLFYIDTGCSYYGLLVPLGYDKESINIVYSSKSEEYEYTKKFTIKIDQSEIEEIQNIRIDEKKYKRRLEAEKNHEVENTIRNLNLKNEKMYWDEFITPTKGYLTTDFGEPRKINNLDGYFHTGLDIANIMNTDVIAANRGSVVKVLKSDITGNTIYIDHGLGLVTGYYHLNKVMVKEGDMVKRGDLIGKMGTTGFSTGSHLHFSTIFDGEYINPWRIINNKVIS